MTPKLLTVKEVADIFRRNVKTIYRWIENGTIRAHKVTDGYLIEETEIKRILNITFPPDDPSILP